jgi:hypothetical protein
MRRRRFLPLAWLAFSSGGLAAQTTSAGPRVIPVYMVPRDMSVSRERLALTVKAIESVRQWYARVLRGKTFSYDPVIVQVSGHSFNEFAADSFQAWWPLLQNEFQGYGQNWEDDDTKMLWIAHGAGAWAGADSENGGIDSIGEAGRVRDGDLGGLAVIGDSSLGGYLAGVCPDSGRTGSAWWCSWYTFMGTIAHELGHTWGLPHPDAFLPGFRCADTTAWTNMQCHWGFPFDSLLPFEQVHLTSLRHFRYRNDAPPFELLTARQDLTGALKRTSFERGDSLLWMEGRGGGTGYIHGLVGRNLSFSAINGWFVADIGLPLGSRDTVTVSLRIGGVERYRRLIGPGDPPLPISLPIRAGQRVRLVATGPLALGNARLIPGTTLE